MINNDFNFKQKELGVLRAFLKQDKLKIVVVGSFALYGIKNQKHDAKLELKFNDLDVDIYKSLYNEISKSLITEKRRDEKVAIQVNHHFDQIVSEIEDYVNVKNVDIWLISGGLDERDGNKGTYGGKLLLVVSDNYDVPYHIYIDINFENKKFDIDLNEYKIENETYTVRTYTYEKILADKYIAMNKRFKYTFSEALSNLQSQFSGRSKKTNNIKKTMKRYLWHYFY